MLRDWRIERQHREFHSAVRGISTDAYDQVTSNTPGEQFEVYSDGGLWIGFDQDFGTTLPTITIATAPALPLTVGTHTGFVTIATAASNASLSRLRFLKVMVAVGAVDRR